MFIILLKTPGGCFVQVDKQKGVNYTEGQELSVSAFVFVVRTSAQMIDFEGIGCLDFDSSIDKISSISESQTNSLLRRSKSRQSGDVEEWQRFNLDLTPNSQVLRGRGGQYCEVKDIVAGVGVDLKSIRKESSRRVYPP